jgi:hypothetical protein
MEITIAENVRPKGSKFFYGETVRHTGDNRLYTVCDLSNYDDNYYGLWPLGKTCAIPTHGSIGDYLEPIAEEIHTPLLN